MPARCWSADSDTVATRFSGDNRLDPIGFLPLRPDDPIAQRLHLLLSARPSFAQRDPQATSLKAALGCLILIAHAAAKTLMAVHELAASSATASQQINSEW
jgi:hypothetical protein